MRNFIREKKIYCGTEYLEVDIYPYTQNQKMKKGKRAKKKKESLLTQKNLNDKNARRKFIQIGEANFGKDDISLTLTYSDEMLPKTIEEAEKEVQNFLRRVKRARQKEGLENLKYMLVTSYRDEEGEMVRVHHHIMMNKGLDRDKLEGLWRKKREKGEKEGKPIGRANADRIQPDYNTGITELCSYLAKNPTQKKRWSSSQNLIRPESRTNDYKYSRRKILKIISEPLDVAYWERQYPGYTIKDKVGGYEAVYNEFTGWSLYLKLRKKE